jgi:hypothetical protein
MWFFWLPLSHFKNCFDTGERRALRHLVVSNRLKFVLHLHKGDIHFVAQKMAGVADFLFDFPLQIQQLDFQFRSSYEILG